MRYQKVTRDHVDVGGTKITALKNPETMRSNNRAPQAGLVACRSRSKPQYNEKKSHPASPVPHISVPKRPKDTTRTVLHWAAHFTKLGCTQRSSLVRRLSLLLFPFSFTFRFPIGNRLRSRLRRRGRSSRECSLHVATTWGSRTHLSLQIRDFLLQRLNGFVFVCGLRCAEEAKEVGEVLKAVVIVMVHGPRRLLNRPCVLDRLASKFQFKAHA